MSEKRKDHAEVVANIVKRLSDADDPDDIILDICQKSGRSWPEAEGLVNRVHAEDERAITARQMPRLLGVALFFFAAGLILCAYGIYAIFTALAAVRGEVGPRDMMSYLLPVIMNRADPLSALQPAIFPYFNVILGFLLSPFSALLYGAAMVFGSLVGMRQAWSSLLERK